MLTHDTLWKLIDFFTIEIDWLIFFFVINRVGRRKDNSKKYILVAILLLFVIGCLNIVEISPNMRMILCIVMGVLFCKYLYEDSLYKCMIVNLLFWLVLMISESISTVVVVLFNDLDSVTPILRGGSLRFQAIVLSKFLLFITLIGGRYFKLSVDFKLKDSFLIGIPVTTNIASLLVIYGYNLNQHIENRYNILMIIIITVLIMLSSISLLFIIRKILKEKQKRLESQLINNRIKVNYQNYERINEAHRQIRYVYHDLKNHLLCLKNFQTKAEIEDYITNLELQIEGFEDFRDTGNRTLDIILGEKIYRCKKDGIEYEDNIIITKLDFMAEFEICALFANALDNAIEACIEMESCAKKYISVTCRDIKGFIIIKIINSKSNVIKVIDDQIYTTKVDKVGHGIGISSIKYITDKYNGEVVINYSDDEFILNIMIPIPS